ncbi:hypothetical protein SAMN02745136_04553 [Anaerocolumna jejuensis DSM 15929]|uniref:Cxxc_20_cxxc protein n=1 Tax=Anaerocolumna jejuensis DSM 15929 TaxID=1121322 RepID=A0A1M6ZCJ0_9FIRM|nr:hypothetical protein [Anaerocolumna jejuensis]SHL28236.1 hypothetical protein SAMN02745136_04553 [Anaerocolumna jejuensis DSM 15929]
MDHDNKMPCRHSYAVGYSFRMPHAFFTSLPCDKCGCIIRLSMPWRILFLFTELAGFLLAYIIAEAVPFKIFRTTFPASLAVFILLIAIVQVIGRLILRSAKWVEADKK